jgi:hypothetical protein
MQKLHTVKASKCTLVFTEPELMGCLALQPDIFERVIGRGKGYLRAQSTARRQTKGLGHWELYEVLKGNPRYLTPDIIGAVEVMPAEELREAVLEYLSAKHRG